MDLLPLGLKRAALMAIFAIYDGWPSVYLRSLEKRVQNQQKPQHASFYEKSNAVFALSVFTCTGPDNVVVHFVQKKIAKTDDKTHKNNDCSEENRSQIVYSQANHLLFCLVWFERYFAKEKSKTKKKTQLKTTQFRVGNLLQKIRPD